MLSKNTVLLLSIAVGVAIEVVVGTISGRREAWDSPAYWSIGLPLAGALSVAIGFLSRGRDWSWTVLIVPSQVLAMMVRSGEMGNLWPLALGLSAVLSAPFVLAAFIGSRLRPKGGRETGA